MSEMVKVDITLPEIADNGSSEMLVELVVEIPYYGLDLEALTKDVQFLYAEDLRAIAGLLDSLKNKS